MWKKPGSRRKRIQLLLPRGKSHHGDVGGRRRKAKILLSQPMMMNPKARLKRTSLLTPRRKGQVTFGSSFRHQPLRTPRPPLR